MARQSTSHLPLSPLSSASLQASLAPTSSSLLCYNKLTCCLLFNLVHLEKSKHPKKMPLGASFRRILEPLPHLYKNYCRVAKVRNKPSLREPRAQLILSKLPEGLRRDDRHGGFVGQATMVRQDANKMGQESCCPIDQCTPGKSAKQEGQ